ncbi:MAG: c-type cytochrome [Acidimicrobiia bacterium]
MTIKKLALGVAVLALALAACGGGDSGSSDTTAGSGGGVDAGDPVNGASVYSGTCATCHGTDLGGIEGLGRELAPSEFVAERTENQLAEFISIGRPADDPANETGVDMPPRGGNPSLSDQDLRDVSAYLKAQQ